MVKELNKNVLLTEMAMDRDEAIERCTKLGKKFIEHFHKVYNSPNDLSTDHWFEEMDAWYSKVKSIVLKQNKKPIRSGYIRDWFFTVCSYPENIVKDMTEDELDVYDMFCNFLLVGYDIKEAFKKANEYYNQ